MPWNLHAAASVLFVNSGATDGRSIRHKEEAVYNSHTLCIKQEESLHACDSWKFKMNRSYLLLASVFIAPVLACTTGCAQLRASVPPIDLVASVAKEAAKEPATWIPLTAAALIAATGTDNDITEWASEETPIFGSQNRAGDYSDYVRSGLIATMALSSVFAPTPEGVDLEGYRKRRVVTNALAFGTIASIVQVGKVTVQRERPNERDDKSFPSGHSSGSFSSAYLIEKNFNATVKRPWLRKTIKFGAIGGAASVAWARVEANEHHPVDVLVSAGLSNLLVKTFYNSIGPDSQLTVPPIAVEAGRKGFMLKLNYAF